MRRLLLLAGFTVAACAGATPNTSALRSGIETANFDRSVRPQDDFYLHTNGKWLETTQIPDDKSNYGSFSKLADEAEANLKAIIEEVAAAEASAGSEREKIAALYKSYMDEAAIEARGLEPLRAELVHIYELVTPKDVVRAFGRLLRIGVRTPLVYYIDQDAKASTRYIGYLQQSGLGLPDRDYYLDEGEKFAAYRKAYRAYVEKILDLAGARAEGSVEAILEIESALAERHWTRVKSRDRDATYNKLNLDALAKLAPDLDWAAFFEGARVPAPDEIVVRQPDYLSALSEQLRDVSVAEWKVYLAFALIDSMAPLLPAKFVEAEFALRGTALSGVSENRPRWKRAVSAVDHSLGFAVGRIYVERHFPPEAKARMRVLVDNLVRAFEVELGELAWMTEATKVEAKKKLAKFVTKIGYPDEWLDYGPLAIGGSIVDNMMASAAFEHDRRVAKLGGPIDRTEWFMTPQTVNAYYNPPMNEIVFPAAILQPPFFDLGADDAANYGAIGAVIGHELSHGFDDQGRKSDGDGNLRDWWTAEDAAEFEARAKKMVAQYAEYSPLPGVKLNGELTLGENIGDLGGVAVAYKAYRLSLGGEEAPVIDGLTGDQRFFLGWSQIWRRKYRDAELQRRVVVDPHSPSQFRVIGILSNMPAFYEAYGVKEGDRMWRSEADRVVIW